MFEVSSCAVEIALSLEDASEHMEGGGDILMVLPLLGNFDLHGPFESSCTLTKFPFRLASFPARQEPTSDLSFYQCERLEYLLRALGKDVRKLSELYLERERFAERRAGWSRHKHSLDPGKGFPVPARIAKVEDELSCYWPRLVSLPSIRQMLHRTLLPFSPPLFTKRCSNHSPSRRCASSGIPVQ